jgi:CRISPR/Cas system-associated exonuclease Cas4 (RecB family)
VESLSLEFKDLDLPKLKKLMEKDNEYKNNNLVKLGIYKNLLGEDELRCNIGDAAFFLNRPDAISQDILKDLDIKISVSKLEKYAQCPYLYYLTYILGLKERRGHDTDQLDLGNIIHSVLEKAFKRVNAEYNGDFNLVSEEQLKEITDLSVIEAVTENKEELLRGDEKTGKDIFVLENIKKIARDTMDTLSFQMKQGKMKPQFVETGFKAEFTAKNPDGTKALVLYDEISETEISEDVYQYFHQYYQTVFNMHPEEVITKDKMLKKWYIDKDIREAKRSEEKKTDEKESILQPLISSYINHPGTKHSLQELKEVGVYEFFDSIKRLQIYESATALMKGMYSGMVDGKKIKPEEYNFMRA